MEQIIDEIRYWHRSRCFAMEQRKRANLSLGSFLRTALGWSLNLPTPERNAIAKRAQDLIKTGEQIAKGKLQDVPEDFARFHNIILATLSTREPWDRIEKDSDKALKGLVHKLPVWEFAEPIKGFSEGGVAVIVAEAGDLSNYANPGKLWKRMCVAVVGDVRQGGLRKGAPKEDWIEHGYSSVRRSRMWNIGESLVKSNGDGCYRQAYLDRLRREHEKAIEEGLTPATTTAATVDSWAARELPPLERVTKLDAEKHRGAGHMANRAHRYMEKRLLKHLWQAWRRQPVSDEWIKSEIAA